MFHSNLTKIICQNVKDHGPDPVNILCNSESLHLMGRTERNKLLCCLCIQCLS